MPSDSIIPTLKKAWASGDRVGALKIAAKFKTLGPDHDAITMAWQAHRTPDFYRSVGKDPDVIIAAGLAALDKRYDLSK